MQEITWEELIVLRRWITMDDMLIIRDSYGKDKDSRGYKEAQMIIDKWTELATIERLLEQERD